MAKKNSFINDILNNISVEDKAKFEESFKRHDEYMTSHPNYNKYSGTDKSYWLQDIREKGFKPLGITKMMCEETIILETQEEVDKAWQMFKPEGFWYTKDNWDNARKNYIKDVYKGIDSNGPKVYWL